MITVLVVALERVERSSGSLVGNNIASIQKSKVPEVISEFRSPESPWIKVQFIICYNPHVVLIQMLLALMDEAYTGSTIGDGGGDSGTEASSTIDVADPLFLELLKDENDGLSVGVLSLCLYSEF